MGKIEIRKSEDYIFLSYMVQEYCTELRFSDEIKKQLLCKLPEYTNWVATIDGDEVGAGGYFITEERTGVAEYFFVKPEFRDSVVGGLLLRKALRDDIKEFQIAVAPQRLEIYTKLGFKPVFHILTKEKK